MRKLIGFIFALTLVSIGCLPRAVTIHSAAQTVRATSLGLSVLEDITIELHNVSSIDRPTAEAIMDFSFAANKTGLEASRFIRSIKEITPDDKKTLEKIVAPILDSIDTLIAEDVIKIKNTATRERIETALFIIRLAVLSMGE